jgi:hypothetical protein
MLIGCPECKKQVSEFASSCPKCGNALSSEIVHRQKVRAKAAEQTALCLFLFFAGLGGISFLLTTSIKSRVSGSVANSPSPTTAEVSKVQGRPWNVSTTDWNNATRRAASHGFSESDSQVIAQEAYRLQRAIDSRVGR